MADPVNTCSICQPTGLAMLLVFHGAIAKDRDIAPPHVSHLSVLDPLARAEGMPFLATHAASVKWMDLPALQYADYVLRSLRPGTFVHIWHQNPPRDLIARAKQRHQRLVDKAKAENKPPPPEDPQAAHWEVLRMVEGGALVPEDHASFLNPVPFACKSDGGTHIHTAMTYRLRDAEQAGEVRIAVSANLWDAKLRALNKPKMKVLDVPKLLGTGPHKALRTKPAEREDLQVIHPSPDWLEKHVADFNLEALEHAARPATSPLARVRGAAAAVCKRMHAMSAGPKTDGMAVVVPLRDPIGTAEALADIARGRFLRMLDEQKATEQARGAAQAIDTLVAQALDKERELQKAQPLSDADLRDPKGNPLYTAEGAEKLPPREDWAKWSALSVMRKSWFDGFMARGGNLENGVTKNSRFIDYRTRRGAIQYGLVIAPLEEAAQVMAHASTQIIRRVQASGKLEQFKREEQARNDKYEKLIDQHNADRAKLLVWGPLEQVMLHHFDPKDPNTPGRPHSPGRVYMDEVTRALVGCGPMTPSLEKVIGDRLLCKPAELQSAQGWAQRGLLANQFDLFQPYQNFLLQQYDWYNGETNKRDKTYDTLKAILGDDQLGGLLRARFSWISAAGRLSAFGLLGFFSAAAVHLANRGVEGKLQPAIDAPGKLATATGKATKEVAQRTAQAAGKAGDAAKQAAQAAQAGALEAALAATKALDTAEAKLATKLCAWGMQYGEFIDAIATRRIPDQFVQVKVTTTGRHLLANVDRLMAAAEAAGKKGKLFNDDTITYVNKLRSKEGQALLDLPVDIDVNTTTRTVEAAGSIQAVGDTATHFKLHVPGVGDAIPMTADQIAFLRWRAHGFDAARQSLVDMVQAAAPYAMMKPFEDLSGGAKKLLTGAADAVGPGGPVEQGVRKATGILGEAGKQVKDVGNAVGNGVGQFGAQLALGGVFLQWQASIQNKANIEMLVARMEAMKGKLNDEERIALEGAIANTRLGLYDNRIGMLSGGLEVTGLIAENLRLVRSAGALMAFAAFGAMASNTICAIVNFEKAFAKLKGGDIPFMWGYGSVMMLYGAGALAFFGGGVEILYFSFAHRVMVQASLRGITAVAQRKALEEALKQQGGKILARRIVGLTAMGLGTVFTLAAFIVEGIIIYHDVKPLERWVENSYFGNSPKYKSWEEEAKALKQAYKDSMAEMMASTEGRITTDKLIELVNERPGQVGGYVAA